MRLLLCGVRKDGCDEVARQSFGIAKLVPSFKKVGHHCRYCCFFKFNSTLAFKGVLNSRYYRFSLTIKHTKFVIF